MSKVKRVLRNIPGKGPPNRPKRRCGCGPPRSPLLCFNQSWTTEGRLWLAATCPQRCRCNSWEGEHNGVSRLLLAVGSETCTQEPWREAPWPISHHALQCPSSPLLTERNTVPAHKRLLYVQGPAAGSQSRANNGRFGAKMQYVNNRHANDQ